MDVYAEENQTVVDLLNKISDLQDQALNEESHFYVAKVLGECHEIIMNLQITSVNAIKENKRMSENLRMHYAGMALQGMLSNGAGLDGEAETLADNAFYIADLMVRYGKQGSKTNGTSDGRGDTSAEDSNRE